MFQFPNLFQRAGREGPRHPLLLFIADVGWFLVILTAVVGLYRSLQSHPDLSKAAVFAVLGIVLAAALIAASVEAWRLHCKHGQENEEPWQKSLAPMQNYLAVVFLAAVLIPMYDRRWASQLRTTILKTSVERQEATFMPSVAIMSLNTDQYQANLNGTAGPTFFLGWERFDTPCPADAARNMTYGLHYGCHADNFVPQSLQQFKDPENNQYTMWLFDNSQIRTNVSTQQVILRFDSSNSNTTRVCDGDARIDHMQLHIAVFDGSTPSDLYRHLSTLGSTTTIAAYNEYAVSLARRTFKDRRGARSSKVSTLFGAPIARLGCTTTVKLNFDDFVEVHNTEEPATDSLAMLTESSALLVRTVNNALKKDRN
ncbi:hypothetical protein BDZ90DRAFT_227458 [Jaminaea rosea]|uniref:Uncharacterized protein n=1 Tax=Jaminaea rosea TaxID=1569628 RepID=A0A316UPP5_9BASI|nr:hypothetical protein BDZ90DRAFT_227458 [Jaminaea rosea]PWN27267.1 hypothetical protein BDZ90DRAFT_227458 [Jaminaea rosea]